MSIDGTFHPINARIHQQKKKASTMKKILLVACLCGVACMVLAATPAVATIGSYPAAGITLTYSGSIRKYVSDVNTVPVTETAVYTAGNDSDHLNIAYTVIYSDNGSTFVSGNYVEKVSTRLIISSSGFMVSVGAHSIRANPSELSNGIGTTLLIGVDGMGDASHTISSEGSMTVNSVTCSYWVATGSIGSYTQTVWLEKTTGMLVGFKYVISSVTVMDMTLTSATNITPDAQATPGYVPAIIIAIAGVLVVLLWKRKIMFH